VAKANGNKRSVALELRDGTRRVPVGNVTIPANHTIPPAGSVVEVKFLYAYPGGSLFQPVYLGPRDDVGVDACVLSQLKYKAGEEEAEG
jgi:bifunctional non-homologous end joining protein LigD